MDDVFTLDLARPITHATVEYAELTLTEPTYRQLVEASKAATPMEQLGALLRLNARVPQGVVDQIGQRDLSRAADFFARFGNGGSPTSAT